MNPIGTIAPESIAPVAEKKGILFIFSVALLLTVIIASAALFFVNLANVRAIEAKRTSIASYASQISALNADRTIMALQLLNSNLSTLNAQIESSMAHHLLAKLDVLKRDYGVNFTGFNYSDKKFNTQISVPANPADAEPSSRLVRFIGDFRTGSGSASGSMLQLAPIVSISGDQNVRNFSAEFQTR